MKSVLGWSAGAIAALIAVFALVIGLIAVVIYLTTASSGARGNASVTRAHNAGSNQIAQNTKLLGDWATLQADSQKIQILARNQSTQQDVINLEGAEQVCAQDTQTYNADAAGILAAGYLPAGQPSTAPTNLCEVSAS